MELPNTKIRSVLPSTAQAGNPKNIVGAWSGGAVDTKRNRLLVWGGGHTDYSGNEMYAVDLPSMSVKRIINPSPSTNSSNCSPALSDGSPVSRHTYDGLTYIAHADRFVSIGGAMATCGSADLSVWTYDFTASKWQRMISDAPLSVSYGFMAAYEPSSKNVYVHDRDNFFSYSLDSNKFTQLNNADQEISLYFSGALDTKRRKFVMVGDGVVKVVDIATGAMTTMSTSNGPGILSQSSPGVEYDPVADRIVAWNGGSSVYALNMDTKVWSQVAINQGPSSSAQSEGTFGRWGYVPQYGVFVLVNDIDENAWVFKLAK